MKPIIGIVTREVTSNNSSNMYGVYEDISTSVIKSGGIPIGIISNTNDIKHIFNIIDGIIFQGGDDFTDYEKLLIKEAHSNNIKTLGICLGMQLMGTVFNGKLKDVTNHKEPVQKYVHQVTIDRHSTLYKILNKDKIDVNSRHKSCLKNTALSVIALSDDNIIEAVEDKNKDFFVGVQWHPESMTSYDENQLELFKYFIKKCGNKV